MHSIDFASVGFPPFSEDITWNDKKYSVTEQICRGIYSFPSPFWDEISEEGNYFLGMGQATFVRVLMSVAKDLVRKLLTVDIAERINIDQALAHPFLLVMVPCPVFCLFIFSLECCVSRTGQSDTREG